MDLHSIEVIVKSANKEDYARSEHNTLRVPMHDSSRRRPVPAPARGTVIKFDPTLKPSTQQGISLPIE